MVHKVAYSDIIPHIPQYTSLCTGLCGMEEFDIAEWLDVVGLTQGEAAQRLGVSRSFITMLLSDPSSPRYRRTPRAVQQRCMTIARDRKEQIGKYLARHEVP